jgi:hypothetical protein
VTRPVCVLLAAAVLGGSVELAAAQSAANAPTRLSAAFGATLFAGYQVGDVTAELRRNATGAPSPLPFLHAESNIDSAMGLDARLGIRLSRTVSLEVGGTYTSPQLAVEITQDVEAGTQASAAERLSQYTVDFSAVVLFPNLRLGTRARPYVLGGGGYLRQLHEGRLQIDTGQTLHAGGGVQYWLRGGRTQRQRPFGARVETRIVYRTGGIDFDEQARVFPTFSALAFFGF